MKTYTEHIFEELVDNSTEEKIRRYLERKRREREEFETNRPHPKTRKELQDLIVDAIKEKGSDVDLNYIDVSGIDNMGYLFSMYYKEKVGDSLSQNSMLLKNFRGDISEWDVSSVKTMEAMFYEAEYFNGDISEWDVSSVKTMDEMFWGAQNFDQDLSNWKVDKAEYSRYTFKNCPIQDCHEPHFNKDHFLLC